MLRLSGVLIGAELGWS